MNHGTNHKTKCIFIHIPKTAGSTIKKALGIRGTHYTSTQIKGDLNPFFWDNYFKFAFVRNPFDKLVSNFFFNGHHFGFRDCTFKEYIVAYKNGAKISNDVVTQHGYLEQEIDFIGRFENLQKDMEFICDKLNKPMPQLSKENSTVHDHYTTYYDDETVKLVEELFEKDLKRFNYKFGD